jgi:hypothetical protein
MAAPLAAVPTPSAAPAAPPAAPAAPLAPTGTEGGGTTFDSLIEY